MENLELRERHIKTRCKQITKLTKTLIEAVSELENTPDDEAAYQIMYLVEKITEAKHAVFSASEDERGNDALDGFESVANAIRAAKEAPTHD